MMETVKKRSVLKRRALKEIQIVRNLLESHIDNESLIIADIGANIGYYTEAFLEIFPESKIHAYEPHPYNIQYLENVGLNENVTIHKYGLYNITTKLKIGIPNGDNNNGKFSIHHSENGVEVDLKNATDEPIRPDIIKIDIEGAEPQLLECTDFFRNTEIIIIEMLKNDDFGINDVIRHKLQLLGFQYKQHTTKNNQIWSRL